MEAKKGGGGKMRDVIINKNCYTFIYFYHGLAYTSTVPQNFGLIHNEANNLHFINIPPVPQGN
jgi:hypothetical protein